MFFVYGILPIIGGLFVYFIISQFMKLPGKALQANFHELCKDTDGVIAGKTYDEIVEVCGTPNSIFGNKSTCTWSSGGYSITLEFDKNYICLGISSEINV